MSSAWDGVPARRATASASFVTYGCGGWQSNHVTKLSEMPVAGDQRQHHEWFGAIYTRPAHQTSREYQITNLVRKGGDIEVCHLQRSQHPPPHAEIVLQQNTTVLSAISGFTCAVTNCGYTESIGNTDSKSQHPSAH